VVSQTKSKKKQKKTNNGEKEEDMLIWMEQQWCKLYKIMKTIIVPEMKDMLPWLNLLNFKKIKKDGNFGKLCKQFIQNKNKNY
jgi:hypothetical protein